jgi:enoyl-CoA hydratase/carnithine racemase
VHHGFPRFQGYAADIVAIHGDVLSASKAALLLSAASAGTEEFLGAIGTSPVLLVELGADDELSCAPLTSLPGVVVVIAKGRPVGPAPAVADIALTVDDRHSVPAGWVAVGDVDAALGGLLAQIDRSPQAAVVLVQVLRAGETLDPSAGLVVESLAYSALQSGPSFSNWLRARPAGTLKSRHESPEAVLVDRSDEDLTITLNRPAVRNAINRQLRDELCSALALANADSNIRSITLRGSGPDFSSGGDLNEFGTLPDPAAAHLIRVSRSPARLLALLNGRVTAHVHGACIGAGIELAAFAHRVVAASNSRFELPEIGIGLIPGAGGTVSIRRRIGRQRTSWMGLSGVSVDVTTAHLWGLVDEVVTREGG